MKLEKKHLVPYLLHGLKMFYTSLDGREPRQWTLREGTLTEAVVNQNKPILHPLSDLTKPITVPGYNDGKEFVPIVELAKIDNKWIIEDGLEDRIYFSPWDTGVCEVFVRTASPEDPRIFVFEIYDYLTQPYRIIQKLFQWHFAVDIPDGTWIDTNTL